MTSAASRSVVANGRLVRRARALQQVIDDLRPAVAGPLAVAWVADAEAQPPELRAEMLGDARHAVVARRAAAEPELRAPYRQVELVVRHQHVLDRDLVVGSRGADRFAAQIHVGARLQQPQTMAGEGNLRRVTLELAIRREPTAVLGGQQIDEPEADVVARRRVLRARIAEPDDQLDLRAHPVLSRMQRPPKRRPRKTPTARRFSLCPCPCPWLPAPARPRPCRAPPAPWPAPLRPPPRPRPPPLLPRAAAG